MAKLGGTKGWLVLTGVAVLVALAAFPVLAGTASASPAPLATADSPSNQWAYGGVGWSNNTLIVGTTELTWNASFGWTVIFTATNTSANTVELEEQRTVGVDLTATLSSPTESATYSFHGQEVDVAFANLTNDSTVYVDGVATPALGVLNVSTNSAASLAESISVTHGTTTKSASLDVSATAATDVQFAPALGVIPLNLTGVSEWNSTATVTPTASWNITYSWANNGFDGQTGSGTKSVNGTLSTPGTVNLTGYDVTKTYGVPTFADHKPRTAIVLIVEGPLGNYDAFVFVPRAFDIFGGDAQPYASDSLGSAEISAQTLYVSPGSRGYFATAGATTFSADTSSVSGLETSSTGGATPAAGAASPGATVVGAPMSVPAAEAENSCLTGGCTAAAAPILSAGAVVVIAGLAVAAVIGTVSVVEWRAYARRRSQKGLVGGYGESWPGGVPPTAGAPGPQAPMTPPAAGPAAPEDPTRRM